MKTTKQIISLVLLFMFGISAVFNILFLLDKVSEQSTQICFLILVSAVFLVSLLGFILKKIQKSETYPVNIMTPVKELGILYSGALIIWVVTYFIAVIVK